ncbi:MATE family efflux transporter [Haloferax sp. DFSO52]|uniref:MATE family efflux transporter n=1 Tax=Haloferax sp. DFSO52 TaxID=3388505 RepID=UPI003A872138
MSSESRIDMTDGAIAPKLLTLSWPLVAGNLLQTLYNLADVFWVGRVGADAVAAVSLMFPMSWMFVSTAMGITAATIALVSQHIGAGEDRAADHVVGQTILLTIAVSVTLATLGFLFRHPLLSLIGAEGAVFTEALAYIEIIFLSLPLTFLFFAFRAALQGAGDTKTAMWLMVVSAGLNVVLDPVLILGFGPISVFGVNLSVAGMGTRGAAIATLIARLFATGVGVYILLRGDWGVKLHLEDLRPDPERLKKLVDIGSPATLDGWARSFSAVVMAGFVARFGPIPTAAYGIGLRLMSVSWSVSGAVGQATATGVGQNLGARTPDRAATVTWTAVAATMGFLFAAAGLVVAFPAEAMRLFIDDQAVVDAGITFLRIIAPSWAFFGGVMVIQGAFRGAGITKASMALSFLSRWIFRVPVAIAVAFTWTVTIPGLGSISSLAWGVEGLWWAYVAGAVGSFVVAVVWFRAGTWREGVLDHDAVPAAGDD